MKIMENKTKKRITFNEWARELRVSTLWDAHSPKNREFIKKLENARFASTQKDCKGMKHN
jgi:predicted HAD superfamily phosphohydrolase YqeG